MIFCIGGHGDGHIALLECILESDHGDGHILASENSFNVIITITQLVSCAFVMMIIDNFIAQVITVIFVYRISS